MTSSVGAVARLTRGLTPPARRGGEETMDRYWLLTWTTYGTWLPGDRRGFVSEVRVEAGDKVLHNVPGTPCDEDLPPLQAYAASIMAEDAVRLDLAQAQAVAGQLRETAAH